MVSKEGMRVFVKKKTSILELPRTTNISELRSFLEVVSYYRRFFKDSAKPLGPLKSLIKGSDKAKNQKITWLDEHEQAFTKKEA